MNINTPRIAALLAVYSTFSAALGCALARTTTPEDKVVISSDNVARLAVVGVLNSGGAEFAAADFSPDGDVIATADYGGSVRFWPPAAPEKPITVKPAGSMVWGVEFSPDGSRLAYWGLDGFFMWDLESQAVAHVFDVGGKILTGAAFAPDGRSLVIGFTNGTVEVWDPSKAVKTASWDLMEGSILSFAFSPGGELLAVGGGAGDTRILLIDARNGEQRRALFGQETDVHDIIFVRNGGSLVTTGPRGVVLVWDLATGKPSPMPTVHAGNYFAADESPDGSLVVVANDAGAIQILSAGSTRLLRSLEHDGNGQIAIFSPDGSLLVTSRSKHEVALWVVEK